VGRLIPQTFYYLHAAALLGWERGGATFVVPSGNLGNLCAGLLAARSGMPTSGFVAAANRNRPFVDYLETGVPRGVASQATVSNAMDVGDPSNLERIRWMYGGDVEALRRDVTAISVSDEETRQCIGSVHERTGYVLDPHAAVAWSAMERLGGGGRRPWVVLATAHPCKFPDVVAAATGRRPEPPPAVAAQLSGSEQVLEIEPSGEALRSVLLAPRNA
jgi:threonine synthase